MIEVIVPTVRQDAPARLVYSLSKGTVKPDLVTIISNETQPFDHHGLRVRYLRFRSDTVAYGSMDVALRCNIGIWSAEQEYVLIQSDDQIASSAMIEESQRAFVGRSYFWANHRYIDYSQYTVDEIIALPAWRGVSRETPVPPAWHGYYSCYSGMLGFNKEFLIRRGGFDMAFNGRHAGEDQQLGKRLMMLAERNVVEILEPPFAWHNDRKNTPDPWGRPRTNVCGNPTYERVSVNGAWFKRCFYCPEQIYDGPEHDLYTGRVVVPYDPIEIEVTIE